VFSHVLNTKVAAVARMLKAIHAQENRKAAQTKAAQIIAMLKEMKLRTAAELLKQKVSETMTYYAYACTHWRQCARIIRSSGLFVTSEDAREWWWRSPTDTQIDVGCGETQAYRSTKWGKRR
jgi:hypothetical protein